MLTCFLWDHKQNKAALPYSPSSSYSNIFIVRDNLLVIMGRFILGKGPKQGKCGEYLKATASLFSFSGDQRKVTAEYLSRF